MSASQLFPMVLRDPAPSTYKMFNQYSGMRGFMAHNWVNDRVGFQGGLALRDPHLRENNSNIQDNIAVGMGILLGF